MTKVAIIRCEKNEAKCPLTSCFKSLQNSEQGFAMYGEASVAGVFTCRCPGDNVVELAKILKAKGAEAIHLCTCLFANKTADGWSLEGGGFCPAPEALQEKVSRAAGVPCVLGSAHLPAGYEPRRV